MKNEIPTDLSGRLMHLEHYAKIMRQSLTAIANDKAEDLSEDTLLGFAALADDMADEMEKIEEELRRQEDIKYAAVLKVGGRALQQELKAAEATFATHDAAESFAIDYLINEHKPAGKKAARVGGAR